MDKHSAVVADVLLIDRVKAAEDVSFELPGLALQTADLAAMGTLSLPLIGLLDDMTLLITKIGVDTGFSTMAKLQKMAMEFRWVQDKINTAGDVAHQGCKAFLNVIPQEIPGVSVELGSASELGFTYTVTRYQLFVNGSEILLVDRLNQILRVNGSDYMSQIKKLL